MPTSNVKKRYAELLKKIKVMQSQAKKVSERIKAMRRKGRGEEPVSKISPKSPPLLKGLRKRVEERRREEKLKPKEPKRRLPLPKWREIPMWKWRGESEWTNGYQHPKRGTSKIHKGPYVGPRARKKKWPPKTI